MPREASKEYFILSFDLPREKASGRVRVHRLLYELGILKIQESLYGMPATPENELRMREALKEISTAGGKGILFRSQVIETTGKGVENEMEYIFSAYLDERYKSIAEKVSEVVKGVRKGMEVKQRSRLVKKLNSVVAEFEKVKGLDKRNVMSSMRSKVESDIGVAVEQLHA